jgi:hypothetical protein
VTREAARKPATPTLSQDSKRVGESALGVLLIREGVLLIREEVLLIREVSLWIVAS